MDLSKGKARKKVCLSDILEDLLFEENYPHIVGFFKGSVNGETQLGSSYLEMRIVRSIEDFWKFLNDLDL